MLVIASCGGNSSGSGNPKITSQEDLVSHFDLTNKSGIMKQIRYDENGNFKDNTTSYFINSNGDLKEFTKSTTAGSDNTSYTYYEKTSTLNDVYIQNNEYPDFFTKESLDLSYNHETLSKTYAKYPEAIPFSDLTSSSTSYGGYTYSYEKDGLWATFITYDSNNFDTITYIESGAIVNDTKVKRIQINLYLTDMSNEALLWHAPAVYEAGVYSTSFRTMQLGDMLAQSFTITNTSTNESTVINNNYIETAGEQLTPEKYVQQVIIGLSNTTGACIEYSDGYYTYAANSTTDIQCDVSIGIKYVSQEEGYPFIPTSIKYYNKSTNTTIIYNVVWNSTR